MADADYTTKIRLDAETDEASRKLAAAVETVSGTKIEVPVTPKVEPVEVPRPEPVEVPVTPKVEPVEVPRPEPVEVPVKPSPDSVRGFNALALVGNVMRGNFAGASVELAKLSSSLRAVGPAAAAAIGGAVYGVVGLVKSVGGLIAEVFNFQQVPKDVSAASAAMLDLQNSAEAFAAEMEAARQSSERLTAQLSKEVELETRMAKARNELARQKELSTAETDEDRARINARYDQSAAQIDAGGDEDRRELRREAAVEEIARLEEEIAASQERLAKAAAKIKPQNLLMTNLDEIFSRKGHSKLDKKQSFARASNEFRGAAEDEAEKQEELSVKLEEKRHELAMLDREKEAAAVERQAKSAAGENAVQTIDRGETKKKADKAKTEANKEKRSRQADESFQRTLGENERRDREQRDFAALKTDKDRIAALRRQEDEARQRYTKASESYATEQQKTGDNRDESMIAEWRSAMLRAQSDIFSARSKREETERQVADGSRQDAPEKSQNRLTQMGLGDGAGPQLGTVGDDVKTLVRLMQDQIAATKAIKPGVQVSSGAAKFGR